MEQFAGILAAAPVTLAVTVTCFTVGALLGVVDSGDSRPTDAAYAVFKELSTRLDEQLAALEKLMRGDVANLNAALK